MGLIEACAWQYTDFCVNTFKERLYAEQKQLRTSVWPYTLFYTPSIQWEQKRHEGTGVLYLLPQLNEFGLQAFAVATPGGVKLHQHIFGHIIHYFLKVICHHHLNMQGNALVWE